MKTSVADLVASILSFVSLLVLRERRKLRGLRKVQKAEGKEKVDWQRRPVHVLAGQAHPFVHRVQMCLLCRNGAFTAFGFAYLGIIQCAPANQSQPGGSLVHSKL